MTRMRTLLIAALAAVVLTGCAATDRLPAPSPASRPTVTATAAPLTDPATTCDQAQQAWDSGALAEASLVAGQALIITSRGSAQFCEVKRSTRGRFSQP